LINLAQKSAVNICFVCYIILLNNNYLQADSIHLLNEWLHERTERLDIFLFPPISQWCSISDVLFTGGRGVSDF